MKKLVKVEEVAGEGFIGLMGQKVTLFCLNYIYTGTLTGVNETFIKLENAAIVYETGAFTDSKYKDAQSLPNDVYVQISAVESYMILH